MTYDHWKTTNPADTTLGLYPQTNSDPLIGFDPEDDDMDTATETAVETPELAPAAQVPAQIKQATPAKETKEIKRASRRSDDVRTVSEIASAIAKITSEVGVVQKQGENRFHGYKYARMSDVLVKLTPLLAKHGIVIFQTELERSNFDDGRVLAVQYEFTIAHSSGEVWPEKPKQTGVCRARDSKGGWDDKAFNKCHTAARKYFLLALFQIATEDEEEADEDRGQERSGPRRAARPAPNVMRQPYDPRTGVHKDIKEFMSTVSVAGGVAYDAQTGEVYDDNAAAYHAHAASGDPAATQPAAEAAPAPLSNPDAGAALDPSISEQIQAEYTRCAAAAGEGMEKLKAVWNTVPPVLRAHLEAAKERKWKPQAREVDAEAQIKPPF